MEEKETMDGLDGWRYLLYNNKRGGCKFSRRGIFDRERILRPISLIDRSIKIWLSVEKLERRERKICIACNLQPRVLFK